MNPNGPVVSKYDDESTTWAVHLMDHFNMDRSMSTATSSRNALVPSRSRECAMAATPLHTGLPKGDKSSKATSFCNVCNLQFCDKCWEIQPTHMFKTLGVTGVPHEKTDPDVAEIVRATLEVNTSDEQQHELHIEDQDTTWFGIVEENGEPTLRDHGRYSDLMACFPKLQEDRCCPGLISFVGPTGAGKSALVKLLVELHKRPGEMFDTPVVGRVDDGLSPTSGDVHLYPDPKSFDTNRPLLYADCEGIQGGDRQPKAATARNRLTKVAHKAGKHAAGFRTAQQLSRNRTLKWAKGDDEKKRREYAVTNLYPRLLYTFTDVVVFVLKSQQSIEKIIVQLLDWAKLVAETSSNQPSLPHAIIALNASANKIDESRWDIKASTAWLMREVQPALTENLDLQRYVRLWRKKGLEIKSVEELLARYYSSFKVIHIPENGRPELIRQQISKLYFEIARATEESHEHKKRQRMQLSASELHSYLQFAFDWFCNVLDRPFDFIQASFWNSSIPLDFCGNITKLALNAMYANHWTYGTQFMVKPLFEGLSYLVGSCIMLGSVRENHHGLSEDIFPLYEQPIEDALNDFCNRGWPCEWIHPKRGARCINMKNGHTKGHQLKSGKVYSGHYQSAFSPPSYLERFRANVFYAFQDNLKKLQDDRRVRQDGFSEERVAALIHRETLGYFFAKVRGQNDSLFSNTSCLACLMNTPEYRLPCGHIICDPCLRAYGNRVSDTLIEIDCCPLPHNRVKWNKAWPVSVKPAEAGVRVLCLDGGGVRGIVELEILKLIQDKLPPLIQIRSFFDLIVGTSTGGLVALGLGAKVWTVETCTNHFNELCTEAFQPRTVGNWGALGNAWNAYHHSRYKTKPLEQCLKKTYCSLVGKEYMFGGTSSMEYPATKVAVVTTTIGGKAAVVSNYNRAAPESLTYVFVRPDTPGHELEVWEAARATSAAPNYFRSYHHEPTNEVYEDGAIYHNNPVFVADSERKLIWPELADTPPDILISIGTGHNPKMMETPAEPKATAALPIPPKRGFISHLKTLKRIAQDHVKVSLDSERTWTAWLQTLSNQPEHAKRFVRLNVSCAKDPPSLDDCGSMPQLRTYVQEQYALNRLIEDIAHRLVASSFYVVPASSLSASEELRCRLARGEIQALGLWLSRLGTPPHNPYFIIRQPRDSSSTRRIHLSDELLRSMTKSGEFSLPFNAAVDSQTIVEILLCLEDRAPRQEHMISGFPRTIDQGRSAGNKKRSQTNLDGPPSPVVTRQKTPILPLGTYTRPTKLEEWDPVNSNRPQLNKNRLRKTKAFFSPDDVGQRKTSDLGMTSAGPPIYELADNAVLSSEMANTSIQAGTSSDDSSEDD